MEGLTRGLQMSTKELAAPGGMTEDLSQKCGLWSAKDLAIIDIGGNICAV